MNKSPLRVVPRSRKEHLKQMHDWLDKIDKGDYTPEELEAIGPPDPITIREHAALFGQLVGRKVKSCVGKIKMLVR